MTDEELLPTDRARATLLGRVWDPAVGGPASCISAAICWLM